MKRSFKRSLANEKDNYRKAFSKRDWIIASLTRDPQYQLWRYHKRMRIAGYYYEQFKSKCGISRLGYAFLYFIAKLRRNTIGNKLSIDIREQSFGEGLIIYHNNIIVNGWAKVGKNCKLHGNNVIGNNGLDRNAPLIGDNVDIGNGAIIIGNVQIANNITIGAGAVVTKSCMKEGETLVGVPAKPIRFTKIEADSYN